MAMESIRPYLAMILVQLLFSGMALISKAAVSKGMNPYVFVVYRQLFATLALSPFAFFLERKNAAKLFYKVLVKLFALSLFGTTLYLNLYYYAIKHTTATFAAASTNTVPAMTFLMAALLRMESICIKQCHGIVKVLGSIVGFAGAFVFVLVKGPYIDLMNLYQSNKKEIIGSSIQHSFKVEWIKGSLLMLSANAVWSVWLIMQAVILKEYPSKLRLATLQCFFSCIQSAIWAMAMERNMASWKLGWDVNLLSVAYCGFIVTGISFWLQLWAIEKKGPVFTATFIPLALIITAFMSAFLWKETLHLGSVFGAILLAIGLYSVLWGKNIEIQERETCKEKPETKEEIMLECITQK